MQTAVWEEKFIWKYERNIKFSMYIKDMEQTL